MAAKGVEMQTIECPVCHENYNEPKILPCAHLLCQRCLVSLMKKKRDALCPLCSSAIVDPQDSIFKSCEDLINSMPTDHTMSAMVESVKVLSEKHVCCAHRSVVATSLCLQCSVKLCQSCVDYHKIIPVTSSHKLEDFSALTLEVLTASRHEPCSEHPDKILELFCTRHNVLICQLCAASQHRTCPEVTGLNEMYDKYKQSLSDLKTKLNITMSSLEQVITRIEEHLVQTDKNMKVTFAEIDKTCDNLVNSVETCRKRLKKLVQDADNKNKVIALEQKSSLGERRGRLTSHLNLIHRVQQMAHGSSLVAMVPKLESLIAKLHLDTALPEESGQGLKMATLNIDPKVSVRLKSELDKLGNLMVSSTTIEGGERGTVAVTYNRNLEVKEIALGLYTAVEKYSSNLQRDHRELFVTDKNGGNISMMVDTICEKIAIDKSQAAAAQNEQANVSTSIKSTMTTNAKKCAFCCDEITDPRRFSCKHEFCISCFSAQHICPVCSNVQQKYGTMCMQYSFKHLAGFDTANSFEIEYNIPSGTTMSSQNVKKNYDGKIIKAYLPDTLEGRRVLMLLKVAFDRNLTFIHIQSGSRLEIVWNGIQHKTQISGGPPKHGYPDRDYLSRVQQELRAKGVTEKDLTEKQKVFIETPRQILTPFNSSGDFSYLFNV